MIRLRSFCATCSFVLTLVSCSNSSVEQTPTRNLEATIAVQSTRIAYLEGTAPAPKPVEASQDHVSNKLGESAQSSGIALTALDIEDPSKYGASLSASQPVSGYRAIAVKVILANNLINKVEADPRAFSLMDTEGFKHDFVGYSGHRDELPITDLARGDKVQGWLTSHLKEGIVPRSVKMSWTSGLLLEASLIK